jgi:hypothetical protein
LQTGNSFDEPYGPTEALLLAHEVAAVGLIASSGEVGDERSAH